MWERVRQDIETAVQILGLEESRVLNSSVPASLEDVWDPPSELRFALADYRELRATGRSPERAFLMMTVGEARAAEPDGHYLHYWLAQLQRRRLGEWLEAEDLPEKEEIRALRQFIHEFGTLGINLRGRRPEVFRAAYRVAYLDPRRTPVGDERDRDPRTILGAVLAALTWGSIDLGAVVQVLLDGPPWSPEAARYVVHLARLYYGVGETGKA